MSSLRNATINYDRGWFFITFQVAFNKSALGVIVDKKCVLNELGQAVEAAWLSQPEHTPALKLDAFVVMPNHFHAVCKISGGAVTPTHDSMGAVAPSHSIVVPLSPRRGGELSRIIGLFKSYTTHLYYKLKATGKCVDIGPSLWADSFYDNLIASKEELERIQRYIAENPARWNDDRFGAVTTYSVGNAELLNQRLGAFVASESPAQWQGTYDNPAQWQGVHDTSSRWQGSYDKVLSNQGAVISTFTSPEERMVQRICLQKHHPFIWVCPGGIPNPLPRSVAQACEQGLAFVCSPVPSKTGVNKQRAIWCNQYVLKQAKTIWAGTIRPGGSLETLLSTYQSKRVERI